MLSDLTNRYFFIEAGPYRFCSEGYTNVLGDGGDGVLCLKIFPRPATWQRAQEMCNAQYSHLATLSEKYLSNFGGIATVQQLVQREFLKYPGKFYI